MNRPVKIRRLPPEVIQAIHRQQDKSEVVIGYVQLTLVALWSILYLVSPTPTGNGMASLMAVPWALSFYALFTLVRLALAKTHRLRHGILVASVVIDIAVLITLVWSFHIQYNQPPSFALKIPTMLYLFIFIALRALRFETRYVLLAGAVSCAGWLTLVGYAIWKSPAEAGITRDFVDYMTSNSILIGAEIDKIVSIIAVTVILALAIHRARTTMVEAISGRATVDDLSRFVPQEVARQIEEEGSRAIQDTHTTTATILFADIENFTGMAEKMPPAALIASLNEYFTLVVKPIEEHGGVVTQFQGDAILASFNLPAPDPDHAYNATLAAVKILRLLETHQFSDAAQYKVRIGISTGRVTGGMVGATERVSYTVHGDAVNLASRLESLNKSCGTRLLLSNTTRSFIDSGALNFTLIDTVKIRGRDASEPVFTISE